MSGTARSSSSSSQLPRDCRRVERGVAFFDLSRMAEWASSEDDEKVAAFFQGFYRLAAEHVEPAGARIVKFIGDAGLVVFEPQAGERAILALCEFSSSARRAGRECGFDTYLNVNVHVGPVLEGTFGSPGLERYDVLGKTVNVAARLGRRGVVLSQQAFRCLSAEGRERFEKAAPPVTYRFRG